MCKPDDEPEPIIAATDRALERGSAVDLEQQLVPSVESGLADRFAAARAAKDFRPGNVAAGRAFVAADVRLTHWVEGVFTVANGTGGHDASAGGHDASTPPAVGHEPDRHARRGDATATHGRSKLQHLPWILTGLLAIAAFVEGAFLVRRRRHAGA